MTSKTQVIFRYEDQVQEVEAPQGADLLSVARAFDIPLPGSCGGQRACSTCHVVLTPESFEAMDAQEPACDEELDLLEGGVSLGQLTPTSRLGCQVKVSATPLDVTIPSKRRYQPRPVAPMTWQDTARVVTWLRQNLLDDTLGDTTPEALQASLKEPSQGPQGVCTAEQWHILQETVAQYSVTS